MKKCGYCKGTGRKLEGKTTDNEKCYKCNGTGIKSK